MFSARDVLLRNGKLHKIWQLGMTNEHITKDQVIEADIRAITEELLANQQNITFRTTSVVMKGVVVLYNKKTYYIYQDCTDSIASISLKYEPKKNKVDHTLIPEGVEPEDSIWSQTRPLDRIINQNSKKGNEPVQEIEMPIFQDTMAHYNVHPESDNELGGAINFDFDDEIEGPEIPMLEGNTDPEVCEKGTLDIDAVPLIPYSLILASSIKFIKRKRIAESPIQLLTTATEISGLYKEAKSLIPTYIMQESESDRVDDIVIPESVMDLIEDEEAAENMNDDAAGSKPAMADLVPKLREAFEECQKVPLSALSEEGDRRSKAANFYAALNLHNAGVVVLSQDGPNAPVMIEAGEQFE